MEIQQFEELTKGQFKAFEDGKEAGLITYSKAGKNKIILDHTEVSDEFRGRKVGNQLVDAAVNYARENNIKILPLCPFAKSVFDKTEEYTDVRF